MSEALEELLGHLELRMGEALTNSQITHGELTVTTTLSHLTKLVRHLKASDHARFSTLVDITAVDWPGRRKRFEVVYHFLSMYLNQRIRVKLPVGEDDIVPSIAEIHLSANWFEREVFDMFGILFSGHPDLRRILTDYGFRGHPLRKDFPTTGYTEVRYDEALKRVVYEPVNLVQEYRQFDFMSPWEGAQYVLPGDEKPKEATK
ncbi:MAG: NADH-quinone oxidoreductase subunit C [Rhodobacteraceae bacterium]|nr:MAG: NADH-quinone oxidoreductase subunit C [Paracoccaceae bacterium]